MNLMRISGTLLLGFSLLLLTAACTEEPENIQELLPGRWELQQATRNGKPTRSLAELFYEFDKQGSMQTNLPIAKGESTYEVTGQDIEQNQNGNIIVYTVTSITDSTLILQTKLRDTPFEFQLLRTATIKE